jgi:toluene monooxygenase system protein B
MTGALAMTSLPVVCNFEDGIILTLITVNKDFTMDQVAEEAAEHFAGRTLPLQPDRPMRVRLQGAENLLPRDLTVEEAKWVPLDTVEVVYE